MHTTHYHAGHHGRARVWWAFREPPAQSKSISMLLIFNREICDGSVRVNNVFIIDWNLLTFWLIVKLRCLLAHGSGPTVEGYPTQHICLCRIEIPPTSEMLKPHHQGVPIIFLLLAPLPPSPDSSAPLDPSKMTSINGSHGTITDDACLLVMSRQVRTKPSSMIITVQSMKASPSVPIFDAVSCMLEQVFVHAYTCMHTQILKREGLCWAAWAVGSDGDRKGGREKGARTEGKSQLDLWVVLKSCYTIFRLKTS